MMPRGIRHITEDQKRLVRLYWSNGLTAKQIVEKVPGVTLNDVNNYHLAPRRGTDNQKEWRNK